MKRAGMITVTILAATGIAAATAARAATGLGVATAAATARLADHELQRLDGSRMRLAELAGEVVVVNFWATWCAPCRRELPALAALHRELRPRGGRVVAIALDHDVERVRRFLRAERLELDVVHDGPDRLARQLDLRAVPLTVVLDRSGAIAFTSSRSDREGLELLATRTRALLAAPAPVTQMEGTER